MDSQQIEEMFDSVAIKYGTMRMFFYEHAVGVINECRKSRIKILGFDSVRISARGIQPYLEFSHDYSTLAIEDSWITGIRDLTDLSSSDFVFDLVF